MAYTSPGEYIYLKVPSPASCRKIARILLDHGAVVGGDVVAAAREGGDIEIISMLVEKFDEADFTDDDELGSMFGNLFE